MIIFDLLATDNNIGKFFLAFSCIVVTIDVQLGSGF